MEYAQIIRKLYISLPKVKTDRIPIRGKMKSVEGLCLGLGDGGNITGPGKTPVPGKGAPGVLDDQPLRVIAIRRLVVQQGS